MEAIRWKNSWSLGVKAGHYHIIATHPRWSYCESLSSMDQDSGLHKGGCRCRKVRWRVRAPRSVEAWKCNCSDCSMRGNVHFTVAPENFELLGNSEEFLTTHTFGTGTAKHVFCKVCGITSFYVPRGTPNGMLLLSDVWILELCHMLRLSTMMGIIGRAHSINYHSVQ
ncbi:GFA domain-containing protein [Citrus sinensis]|nr:GFA domain-containing protein [Citrus sinensis]